MLPLTIPAGADLKIAVVCGFPSGKHDSSIKATEGALTIEGGADESDMVIDIVPGPDVWRSATPWMSPPSAAASSRAPTT
jgi:hypothetical protein